MPGDKTLGSQPIWQLASDSLNLIANVDTSKPQSGSYRVALAPIVDEGWVTQQRHSQEPAVKCLLRHARQTGLPAITLTGKRNHN